MERQANFTLDINITFQVLKFNFTRPIYNIVSLRVSAFPFSTPPKPAMNENTTYNIALNKLTDLDLGSYTKPLEYSYNSKKRQEKKKLIL